MTRTVFGWFPAPHISLFFSCFRADTSHFSPESPASFLAFLWSVSRVKDKQSKKVEAGSQPPYYYQKKAYIRNDTSTIEVSDYELNDLILKGRNQTYDKLLSRNQNLTFHKLTDTFQNETNNTLSTNDLPAILGLYTSGSGYNNAGLLFSDQNIFPGIRIVKFGKDENTIWLRRDLENISIIEMMENALDIYRQQYQPETIDGAKRSTKSLIPEESFREALANALVHRNWGSMENRVGLSMNQADR